VGSSNYNILHFRKKLRPSMFITLQKYCNNVRTTLKNDNVVIYRRITQVFRPYRGQQNDSINRFKKLSKMNKNLLSTLSSCCHIEIRLHSKEIEIGFSSSTEISPEMLQYLTKLEENMEETSTKETIHLAAALEPAPPPAEPVPPLAALEEEPAPLGEPIIPPLLAPLGKEPVIRKSTRQKTPFDELEMLKQG
jgi:hypothetical protein